MIARLPAVVFLAAALTNLAPGQDNRPKSRDRDVLRIAQMHGFARQQALRELLLGLPNDTAIVIDSLFRYERQLRPALLALLDDKSVGQFAAQVLTLIAERDDIRRIIAHPPPAGADGDDEDWIYAAVSSLIDPNVDQEWAFVRKCALGQYQDPWAQRGAIQTLKLTASARSREILQEIKRQTAEDADSLAEALAYLDSAPPDLAGPDLEALSARVAQAVKLGYWTWTGNSKPVYNEGNDKALVACSFVGNLDRYIYTATFHKIQGNWKLRAVRETEQRTGPPPPPRAAQ